MSSALPHNPEAERTVLGAVLLDNAALGAVSNLEPADFYAENTRRTFAVVMDLARRGGVVDLVTVKDALVARKELDQVGGPAFVGGLLEGLPRVSNVGEWVGMLRQLRAYRDLARLSEKLHEAACEREGLPAELIARATDALLKLGAKGVLGRGPLDNATLVKGALRNIEARAASVDGVLGYRTGIDSLDAYLGGIRGGRMGVIAARLGNGKSILAAQVAATIATQDLERSVLFFSLEMDGEELMERRLAAEALVNPVTLATAPEAEKAARWGRLCSAAGRLMVSNLRVIEDAWTVAEVAQLCRQERHERGLAAVFVDYVQLMRGERTRYENRTREMADISVSLRKLAKDLGVPLVVVAQLNREAAEKGGKIRAPQMSDLAESDNLGRDCHWCVMIDPQERGTQADLYVRKNRGGIKGQTRVKFEGGYARFSDLLPQERGA